MSEPAVDQDPGALTAADEADSPPTSRLRSTVRQVLALAQHAGDARIPF